MAWVACPLPDEGKCLTALDAWQVAENRYRGASLSNRNFGDNNRAFFFIKKDTPGTPLIFCSEISEVLMRLRWGLCWVLKMCHKEFKTRMIKPKII